MKTGKYRYRKFIVGFIIIACFLGLAGLSLADVNNGDENRAKSVRIQDVQIWVDGSNEEGIITEPHYADVPFDIYLFVTNPGNTQNIIVAESTTFHLTLMGPDGYTIDLGDVTLDDKGMATVSDPISVTIPFGGDWEIAVTTPNDNYNSGGGGSGGGSGSDAIIVEVPIMVQAEPILEITPVNTTINVGQNVAYTAQLVFPDAAPDEDITTETTWTVSDEMIAQLTDTVATFEGSAPGICTITATYGALEASTTLTVVGVPDHFAVVPYNTGDPAVPRLNIRSDTGPSTSTWGYIGEPMTLNVALQMQDSSNNPIEDYSYDTNWFSNPVNWGITITSFGDTPDPAQLSISVIGVTDVQDTNNNPVLKATLKIIQNDSSVEKEFNDFKLEVNPVTESNIGLKNPAAAFVFDTAGNKDLSPYNLYRGRIKVEDDYFNSSTGIVNVSVEKYHNGFITNTFDSTSSVDRWTFDGAELIQNITFNQGKAQVTVSNDSSNTVILFAPKDGYYPSYFQKWPGNLTWGQIINHPPTSGEGSLWEYETPNSN